MTSTLPVRLKRISPKCLVITPTQSRAQLTPQFLSKFFPKFIDKLVLDQNSLKDERLIPNIKRIKSIRSIILLKSKSPQASILYSLLKVKRRYIKDFSGAKLKFLQDFHYVDSFNLDLFHPASWRIFSSLQSLKNVHLRFWQDSFLIIDQENKEQILAKLRWRFPRHLSQLKGMKHLRLEFNDQSRFYAYVALRKLNEISASLRFLKTFTVVVYHSLDSEKDSYNIAFKNIFQQITSLSLENVYLISSDYFLKNLKHFHNLQFLKLALRCQEDIKNFWNFERLKYVADLKRLEVLDFIVFFNSKTTILSYFKNFCLPKSVRSVNFAICSFAWDSIFTEPVSILQRRKKNPFEDHEIFSEFYNKWSGLENLNYLKVYIADQSNSSSLNDFFTVPILRKLSKVTVFSYISQFNENSQKLKIPLNLEYFWQGVKHLGSYLNKIYIEDFAISLRKFHDNTVVLPSLKELKLKGYVLGDDKFDVLIKTFPNNKLNDPQTESKLDLNVKELVVDNNESFKKMLKTLENVPRNLAVSLTVNARKILPTIITKDICYFLSKTKIKGFVSLTIKETAKFQPQSLQRMKESLIKFPIFARFSIETRHKAQTILDTDSKVSRDLLSWDSEEEEDEDENSSMESLEELRDRYNDIDFSISHKFSQIVDI